MLASLSVEEIHPADFYHYLLLVTTYVHQDLNNTRLKEIAIRIEQEEVIRFIPVEEIINLAKMNSNLNETICAAIVRVDRFKDDNGVFQYTFNLKQLDRIIEGISESASLASLSILIKYMKSKMNPKFVDANLGSKTYVHAVATIDAFLEHNSVPGPTARLVIFNLCKNNPQILEYIKTYSTNNYIILTNSFTSQQKSILGMEIPLEKPLPEQKKKIEPKELDENNDQEERRNCSIM